MSNPQRPTAVVGVIAEALGLTSVKDTDVAFPEMLFDILERPFPVDVKLIALNCAVKNCGDTPISVIDPTVPRSEIRDVITKRLDDVSMLICIQYTRQKDCHLLLLANRRFEVKRILDPSVLETYYKPSTQERSSAKSNALARRLSGDL